MEPNMDRTAKKRRNQTRAELNKGRNRTWKKGTKDGTEQGKNFTSAENSAWKELSYSETEY